MGLFSRVAASFTDGYRRTEDALDRRMAAAELLSGVEARLARVEADLLVLKCLCGAGLAGILALLVKAFI